MAEGWISLHRKIKKHWIWQNSEYLKIWIDLLLRANHEEKKVLFNDELVVVKRGEFITSLKKLAKENNCSIGKIRNTLDKLEYDTMIERNTTQKATRISICNYESYQDSRHTESILKAHRKHTESTLSETNNNINNENNDNNNNYQSNSDVNKIPFDWFWDAYDKKVGSKEKLEKKWDKLSDEEKVAALKHIDLYKKSQPDKKYRKNPETYLNNKSWNDEIIWSENGTQGSVTENRLSKLAAISEDIFNDPDLK